MDALQTLLSRLQTKEDLNIEFSCQEISELFDLARQAGPSGFQPVAQEISRWMALFEDSPQQRFGKEILKEYFHALETSARQLAKTGEIHLLSDDVGAAQNNANSAGMSSALVLRDANLYSPLERCKILNRSEIPQTLTRAADAFRRRIELVDSVLETGFELLQCMNQEAFNDWILAFLVSRDGEHEPELIRDVLRVLLKADAVEGELLEWALRWSSDQALLEQWPYVVALSDKVLCREWLTRWEKRNAKRNGLLDHLALLVRGGYFDEGHLLTWMRNALEEFGSGVHRVLSLKLDDETQNADGWRSIMVRTELERLAAIYEPIMVICGETLTRADGANTMAMACLGLIGHSKEIWEEQVLKLSEKAVLKIFLYDLKIGRKPVDTIRTLTFGDKVAFDLACAELDLVSQSFDSVTQRNKVVKRLSYFYASYRHGPLLGQEVARRYRSLMRILHDDYLKNILTEQDYKAVCDNSVLRELSGLATASRRYLDHRRALNMSLEEMLASEVEFVQEARLKRMAILRKMSR